MLEIRLNQPGDLELREMEPLRSPGEEEIRLQTIYGGICGSDLSLFQGRLHHATYPLRPGHEILGKIVEAGKEVGYDIGTRVVILPNTFCGECDFCLQGRTNLCRHKRSLGVNADGGFAEEWILPGRYVLPIPDNLPDEKEVLIEPFAVVVHAFNKVNITEGTAVLIVGCGNEGMLATCLADHLGADVTAVDLKPSKREWVSRLGRVRAAKPEEIDEETFDVVIEAAGTKLSVEQSIQHVAPGGAMVMIGMTQEANIPVMQMVRQEWTLYGSIIYNYPDDYLKSIQYLRDERFKVDEVVSEILPFSQAEKAYEKAMSGEYGKILLDFRGS